MALEKHVGDRLRAFTFNVGLDAKPLTSAQEKHENVLSVGIQAATTNTASVFVGDRNSCPVELAPGDRLTIEVSRMGEIWAKGAAGDKLACLAIITTGELSRPLGA